jgi:hypothetical protein
MELSALQKHDEAIHDDGIEIFMRFHFEMWSNFEVGSNFISSRTGIPTATHPCIFLLPITEFLYMVDPSIKFVDHVALFGGFLLPQNFN